jgi:hypothetical protein
MLLWMKEASHTILKENTFYIAVCYVLCQVTNYMNEYVNCSMWNETFNTRKYHLSFIAYLVLRGGNWRKCRKCTSILIAVLCCSVTVAPLLCVVSMITSTGYGLQDRGVGVWVPEVSRGFFSLQSPDRLWGPPRLYPKSTATVYPGINQPEREVDCSPPTTVEFKKMWTYIQPPYAFITKW